MDVYEQSNIIKKKTKIKKEGELSEESDEV